MRLPFMKDRKNTVKSKEANVLLAKCSQHGKTLGMRVETYKNDWIRTWSFKIDDSKAKREGFDKTLIEGTLTPTDDYPGCPYCGTMELFICPCGKLSCIQPDSRSVKCYWCNATHKNLAPVGKAKVSGGGF